MIGIDFTWIDLNGKLTNSLEVFTCDLLDCIADQNQQKNFVIITHPMIEKVIRGPFPYVPGIWNWWMGIEIALSYCLKKWSYIHQKPWDI